MFVSRMLDGPLRACFESVLGAQKTSRETPYGLKQVNDSLEDIFILLGHGSDNGRRALAELNLLDAAQQLVRLALQLLPLFATAGQGLDDLLNHLIRGQHNRDLDEGPR